MHPTYCRLQEYSTRQKITIFAGSYNLNGQPYQGESLEPWILQHLDRKLATHLSPLHRCTCNELTDSQVGHEEPDIFCIGFQEIVKLSPQQVRRLTITIGHATEMLRFIGL